MQAFPRDLLVRKSGQFLQMFEQFVKKSAETIHLQ